jgi:hypothetical protein
MDLNSQGCPSITPKPTLLFAIASTGSMEYNTIYARIRMIMRHKQAIVSCAIDRENNCQLLDLSSGNELILREAFDISSLRSCSLVPLDPSTALSVLKRHIRSIKDIEIYLIFDTIYNEYHHVVNVLARKLFGKRVGFLADHVTSLGMLAFCFALRRHGLFSQYSQIISFASVRSSLNIFTDLDIPKFFFYGKRINVSQIDISAARGFDCLFSRLALPEKVAVVLGDSPSHMDHNPTNDNFKSSSDLAVRLSSYLMSKACEFEILPHPRDPYFSSQVASKTNFPVVVERPYPQYQRYFTFVSSYLVALIQQKNIHITILEFQGEESLGRHVSRKFCLPLEVIP